MDNKRKLLLLNNGDDVDRSTLMFYKHFYDTAPVGFYTTNLGDGAIIKANLFCAKLLGFDSLEEMKQRNTKASEFYSSERRDELKSLLTMNKQVTDFEIELKLLNGDKKWVILTARFCKESNCIEGSITDITDRKEMELELEKYKSKEIESLQRLQETIKSRLENFDKAKAVV